MCSVAWQRGTSGHFLPREGLLSLDMPQRELPSALTLERDIREILELAMDYASGRTSHNVKHTVISQSLSSGCQGQESSSRLALITNQIKENLEAQPLLLIHLSLKALRGV